MNQQVHNNERENRTQAMRFYAFTFTGKQRDAETRLSYFGARYSTSFRDVSWQRPQASLGALLLKRYYDADLATVWLSMDPMSDKYPSLSPYNYCAGNPMKLVDPDGRDWYIPEGQSSPVYDKRITEQNCPQNATYIGETAHWFGQTDNDMQYYYHGAEDGSLSKQDMTVTITPDVAPNSPSSLYGAMVHAGVCSAIERTTYSKANNIYDPIKGTWLGKNGKIYSTDWGGNGHTGGRSVAQKASERWLQAGKISGKVFGAATAIGSATKTEYDYSHGTISNTERWVNHGVEAASLIPGIGSAIAVGYELIKSSGIIQF